MTAEDQIQTKEPEKAKEENLPKKVEKGVRINIGDTTQAP